MSIQLLEYLNNNNILVEEQFALEQCLQQVWLYTTY
jgi:hypothetical protein